MHGKSQPLIRLNFSHSLFRWAISRAEKTHHELNSDFRYAHAWNVSKPINRKRKLWFHRIETVRLTAMRKSVFFRCYSSIKTFSMSDVRPIWTKTNQITCAINQSVMNFERTWKFIDLQDNIQFFDSLGAICREREREKTTLCDWFRNFTVLIKWIPLNSCAVDFGQCYALHLNAIDVVYDERWCLRYNLFFFFFAFFELKRDTAEKSRYTLKKRDLWNSPSQNSL